MSSRVESGTTLKCLICGKDYTKGKTKNKCLDKCDSCRISLRRNKVKEDLVELKGGKCVKCGYSRCYQCLTFHHLDPSQKEFGIAVSPTRSLGILKREIEKCILLCHNCHGELHAGLWSPDKI
jgi:hypothetical protein